jgi:hypothetical protein
VHNCSYRWIKLDLIDVRVDCTLALKLCFVLLINTPRVQDVVPSTSSCALLHEMNDKLTQLGMDSKLNLCKNRSNHGKLLCGTLKFCFTTRTMALRVKSAPLYLSNILHMGWACFHGQLLCSFTIPVLSVNLTSTCL